MCELDTTALEKFLQFALTDEQGKVACALLHRAIAEAHVEIIGTEAIIEVVPEPRPLAPAPLLFPDGCDQIPNGLDVLRTAPLSWLRAPALLILATVTSLVIGFCFGNNNLRPTVKLHQAQAATAPTDSSLSPDIPVCAPLMPTIERVAPPNTKKRRPKTRHALSKLPVSMDAAFRQTVTITDSLDRLIKQM